MTELEEDFQAALTELVDAAKALGHPPKVLIGMIDKHGAVGAARRLLAHGNVQTGLGKVVQAGNTRLSVEARVLEPRFRALFTDEELQEAHRRLRMLGADPKR